MFPLVCFVVVGGGCVYEFVGCVLLFVVVVGLIVNSVGSF